ncbi:M23 family metallopeptidase [Flavimarina sp. Hel_I_48]|uniref:M23 family metallopeptidase n=1 Tax=Flavimarina sp. Hel_I_48 TaxID=1392488 RepID=UPI0004DF94E2|nr:M23 family metallopeptidase [Flavimarina sp. Hel_I_48]
MRTIFFAFVLAASLSGYAQDNIPTTYFKNPLDIPIILAGDFGELRGGHFHSGMDIKTQHREGLAVNASAGGSVSRIKIQRYGYGKAIYVQHPNGYTSVYAHLSSFSPSIEAYVKGQQYAQETYAIELYPKPGELQVEQGELIAYSGNTGGSTAPHLHFEIRDASQRPMNGMLFGIEVPDTSDPIVSELMVYPLGDSSQVNQSQYRQNLSLTKQPDGSFISEKIEAFGPIGFGIATVDQQDGAPNKNGIYTIETSFNGNKNLEVRMDKFSFAETGFVKRMIDYAYYETDRKRVQKLFIEPNNPLSIFTQQTNKGIIDLKNDGVSYVYNIMISDFKGNKTSVLVPISVKKQEILAPREVKKTGFYVNPNESQNFNLGKYEVYFPKGAFFDEHYLDLSEENNKLHLGEDLIPVAKNISIRYDASGYSAEDREHLYIGSVGYNDKLYYTGAYLDGTTLIARTKTLTDYTVGIDDTPPKIVPVDVAEGKWMSTYDVLQFKITDEETGIKDFRATINGKFILMEYEYKDDLLTYHFSDNIISETENNLKLIVTDNVGNSTTFTTTFFRKK